MPGLTPSQLQTLKTQADQFITHARDDETTLLGALAGSQTPATTALLAQHKEALLAALQTTVDNVFRGGFATVRPVRGKHTARNSAPRDVDKLDANFDAGTAQLNITIDAILGNASDTLIERNIIRSRIVMTYGELATDIHTAAQNMPQGRRPA